MLSNRFSKILETIRDKENAYTRVAFVGQPGAGKSSIINNIIGQRVAEVGQKTDITRESTEYEFHFLKLVDIPGYGTELFVFDEWNKMFEPKQYDVIIYVFSGKLLSDDCRLFEEIYGWNNKSYQRPLFLVRNHCNDIECDLDRIKIKNDIYSKLPIELQKHVKNNNLFFVDCGRCKVGIELLREALLNYKFKNLWKERIVGKFNDVKIEYLRSSRRRANNEIDFYKKLAGSNGINPFFGVDVAAEVAIYFQMFKAIREAYDIADDDLNIYYGLPVAKKLLELLTKQGVLVLLKSFGSKVVAKNVLKYIPFAGQATSAVLSWKLASMAGSDYSADCYLLADSVMEKLIDKYTNEL